MILTDTYIKDTYGNVVTIGTVPGHPTSGILSNGYGDLLDNLEFKHSSFPETSFKVTSSVHGYSLLFGGSDIWFTRPYHNSYIRAAALGSELRFTSSNAVLHDKSPITIKPNGNVMINTNIDSGYNLRVNGTFTSNSAVIDGQLTSDSVVTNGIQVNGTTTSVDVIATGLVDADSLKTGAPLNEQPIATIKFGEFAQSVSQLAVDTQNYIPVEINGIVYKLLISL